LEPKSIAEAGETSRSRPLTEADRQTVRELVKQLRSQADDSAESSAGAAVESAWPTDDDSLFLKYGSFTRGAVDDVIASWQAILDWQRDGPFENKASEVLPESALLALQTELDWLRNYRAQM